jgi:hypothetical protein
MPTQPNSHDTMTSRTIQTNGFAMLVEGRPEPFVFLNELNDLVSQARAT